MHFQLIRQQGGKLFTDEFVELDASVAKHQIRTHHLQALAASLADVQPDTKVWCHSALSGLVIDYKDDYRTGFARVDWDETRYRFEMHWPLIAPPSDQNLVWAWSHAKLIGHATDLPHAQQMFTELLAAAPRIAPAIRMRGLGMAPPRVDLARPSWSPIRPWIDHQLDKLQKLFLERSQAARGVPVPEMLLS